MSTTTFFPYRPDPKAGPDSSLTLLNDTPIDAVPPKTIDPNAKIIVPSTMYENYKKGNTAKGYEA
ncbi:hypothetical protein FACS1894166_03770 [Bacilli bacterium]|nr:hypothetical protein FACS1894166_03770 [Bacilli bacterium]